MNGRRGYRIQHLDGEESFVPTLTGLNVSAEAAPATRPARPKRQRAATSEAFRLLVLSLVLVFLAVLGGHALALIQTSCGG